MLATLSGAALPLNPLDEQPATTSEARQAAVQADDEPDATDAEAVADTDEAAEDEADDAAEQAEQKA
jgi:hypothetical protein